MKKLILLLVFWGCSENIVEIEEQFLEVDFLMETVDHYAGGLYIYSVSNVSNDKLTNCGYFIDLWILGQTETDTVFIGNMEPGEVYYIETVLRPQRIEPFYRR